MEFQAVTPEEFKHESSLQVGTDEFFQHYKEKSDKHAQQIFDIAKREANILIRVYQGKYVIYKNRFDVSGIECSAENVLDHLKNYPNTVVINY